MFEYFQRRFLRAIINSLGPTVQKLAADPRNAGKTPRRIAFDQADTRKGNTYHREIARDMAYFYVFIQDANGGFRGRDPDMDANGKLPPSSKYGQLFSTGSTPLRGNMLMSLEEGLIRLLSGRAARIGGTGLYDSTLDKKSATGIIFGHYARRFSFTVLKKTTQIISTTHGPEEALPHHPA